MKFLAYGSQPGGPTDKLCPSEEPNEAMAEEAQMEGWFPRFRGEHTRQRIAMR